MEEVKENTNNKVNDIYNRLIKISGATTSITIITTILYFLKIIPLSVSISIGFFVSLPLVYSFIFGIITNKQNFTSTLRHYSFLIYLIISLVIYLIILKPDSILLVVRYSFHFLIGLILAAIGYFLYATTFNLSKKLEYRWRALIGFGISFLVTLILAIILKYYKIFELVS